MDSKVRKLIEICGFEESPDWHKVSAMFNVDWENYARIVHDKSDFSRPTAFPLRDRVISTLLQSCDAKPIPAFTKEDDLIGLVLDPYEHYLITLEPLALTGEIHLPGYGVHIFEPVRLGEGVMLTDTIFHAPAYVEDGATIEYTSFQSKGRSNYVGANAVVSNVREFRGSVVMGGPEREEGRARTYLHASSTNNTFWGSYSGASVGTDVFNHPESGEPSRVVDPETLRPHALPQEERFRKLPVLVGYEAAIGPKCLLVNGAVIGAGVKVPMNTTVKGGDRAFLYKA